MCSGPRDQIIPYFESLGYHRPDQLDEADFLQELPTPDGRRFINSPSAPIGGLALGKAWKGSDLYQQLLSEMRYPTLQDARHLSSARAHEWYEDQSQPFASNFAYYFYHCLARQMKIVIRDSTFTKARIGQSLLVGAIAGSLFNNIAATDTVTLNGFLFNTLLFSAMGSFAILPIVFAQKAVFYKQKDALFFPTAAFTLAQSLAFLPLQIIENILYISIVYWSADLSDEERGSRFLMFVLLSLLFSMVISQLFRLFSACLPSMKEALPAAGVLLVVMVLFSGFIQPKSLISDGWIWFYWMNPIAWALKGVTVSELTSSTYDFPLCLNADCSQQGRYGDVMLTAYGNPTSYANVWYSVAVLFGEYCFLFVLTLCAMQWIRTEPVPTAPTREEDIDTSTEQPKGESKDVSCGGVVKQAVGCVEVEIEMRGAAEGSAVDDVESAIPAATSSVPSSFSSSFFQLPFEPLSFAFRNMWYSVPIGNGEEMDLLRDVSGYFEPATMTALMGSSGAGKTTLLDVLAGRKTAGTIRGEIFLNGLPKEDVYFRKVMGYVEQFDTLTPKATAREAILFSTRLRLPGTVSREDRLRWVETIIQMLDLAPIADDLVSTPFYMLLTLV